MESNEYNRLLRVFTKDTDREFKSNLNDLLNYARKEGRKQVLELIGEIAGMESDADFYNYGVHHYDELNGG